jgi:hypothetical protein
MERTLRDVPVRDLQLDECWTYCLKKKGHLQLHEMNDKSIGSQYVYISCNGMAEEIRTNRHCILESFGQAYDRLHEGAFNNAEPGPYRIFAVYSVEWPRESPLGGSATQNGFRIVNCPSMTCPSCISSE